MTALVIMYLAFSFVTFVSYQVIPNAIEGLHDESEVMTLVKSNLFTFFVRYCGMDHVVMSVAMAGLMFGLFDNAFFVWIAIVISSGLVAVISSLSAFVIWRASK